MSLNHEKYIIEAAQAQALPVTPEALPAVISTLQILELMAQDVMSFTLDPSIEAEQVFTP